MKISDKQLERYMESATYEVRSPQTLFDLAKELLETRAQLNRVTGNAPITRPISEEIRKTIRHNFAISAPVGSRFALDTLDYVESLEHENARLKAVLLDRRLDDGAEQLRERCAQAAYEACLGRGPENKRLSSPAVADAVRAVEITGEVTVPHAKKCDCGHELAAHRWETDECTLCSCTYFLAPKI